MNEIIKSFSLSFLLRSAFSGAFFVISFAVASGDRIQRSELLNYGLPSALVAGVAIYGLHRSILYPLFEFLLNHDRARKMQRGRFRGISANTTERLIQSWEATESAVATKRAQVVGALAVWADYIHLQFCSAWGIILGAVSQEFIVRQWLDCDPPLVCLAVVFLLAAVYSNWRACAVREAWREREEKGYLIE